LLDGDQVIISGPPCADRVPVVGYVAAGFDHFQGAERRVFDQGAVCFRGLLAADETG
jgi:hypothetical protein